MRQDKFAQAKRSVSLIDSRSTTRVITRIVDILRWAYLRRASVPLYVYVHDYIIVNL